MKSVEIFKKIIRQDLYGLLPKINTHTLVLWGKHDTYTPLRYGKKIAKQLKNSELKICNSGTHGLHLNKRGWLLEEIKKFSQK